MTLGSNFRSYGQTETLISSIRNIIKDYPFESIFKEFLQNADDAGAKRFHVIVDDRSHPTKYLLCDEMKEWQGPAILIFNDARFKGSDFDSLMRIRVGGKQDDYTKIGKHGLGFNSCYHFTDVPSFISGDSIAFLDPQEKFLPKRNNIPQRGIIGPFPKNGIRDFSERHQFVPYEGIEGIDFQSTFNGTLFRIPLRQRPSEISDRIFSVKEVLELFKKFNSNATSQFLFLRNIEEIEVSSISNATSFQIDSLWKAIVNGLDEGIRNKRKHIENEDVQIFQMEIELIYDSNTVQNDQWIIAIGAQPNPDDSELQKYAKRYRLRALGGVAALLKSKIQNDSIHPNQENEKPSDFNGRLFSTFPLPDTTCLPVHLNGTWAQGSDRARLLIEKDNKLPDMDHQKLNWNRHILLEFLPDLHCKLLEEIIKLQNYKEIDFKNCISKFWPFPLSTHSYPKYVFSYGCKVLQCMLQSETLFQLINSDDHFYQHSQKVYFSDENNNIDILFKCLSIDNIEDFYQLLRNNWSELGTKKKSLKLMIRKLPIWPVRWFLGNLSLKFVPVSIGYFLPIGFQMYRPKSEKIFLNNTDVTDVEILRDLGATWYEIHDYAFNDVELPEKSDHNYVNFLDSVLDNATSEDECKITKDLKKFNYLFPNAITDDLMPISKLFNYENLVFRTVFGGNSNAFLHRDLIKHKRKLSNIGFNDELNSETFNRCALKIEALQEINPPPDIRHRGFVLVDHFYKDVKKYELEKIDRIPFVPISKFLYKPYDKYYNQPQFLDCFNNIIHPQYKGVAWSQKALFAEDVIPPPNALEKYPSLGKPSDITVIKHLKFLRNNIIDDDEWRNDWKGTFVSNVFEVYDWLEEKCSNENLRLSEYIKEHEPLFLNLGKGQDPFDTENWVAASNLVLNVEPGENKYINPRLSKYYAMLKSAGVKEIKAPNVKIQVREHDQSSINKKNLLEILSNQVNSLHDVVFNVNGEEIWASRSDLAASSKFFYKKFTSGECANSNPATIDINDVSPTSVRILLHYLYGQNIDNAIWSYHSNTTSNFETYRELLALANDYELDHLKELMELKLSRTVNRSNVKDILNLTKYLNASQLEEYCNRYIEDNKNL
ncbi:5808_t:CDS:2 [Diversispora eburnea]|uniref:5808_t:CDS:1 n=1 Tax=Diversispora eburnea TaxID=1213867 RepID=A0A9N9BKU7_9GLOM|nr:5808_t:CDS:2 [Diversispora eburnea]